MNYSELKDHYRETRREIAERSSTPGAAIVFAILAFGFGVYFSYARPKPEFGAESESVTLKDAMRDNQEQIELTKTILQRDAVRSQLSKTLLESGLVRACGFRVPAGWAEVPTNNPKICVAVPKNSNRQMLLVQPVQATDFSAAWKTVFASESGHVVLRRESFALNPSTEGVLTDLMVPDSNGGQAFSQRRIYVLKKITVSGTPCIFWGTLVIATPQTWPPSELGAVTVQSVSNYLTMLRSPFQTSVE